MSGVADSIGADLQHFGGLLRCERCGWKQPLGVVGERLKLGWPKHCGYTMRWWTRRQIDAGEMPAR